jgi:hypothetical protein
LIGAPSIGREFNLLFRRFGRFRRDGCDGCDRWDILGKDRNHALPTLFTGVRQLPIVVAVHTWRGIRSRSQSAGTGWQAQEFERIDAENDRRVEIVIQFDAEAPFLDQVFDRAGRSLRHADIHTAFGTLYGGDIIIETVEFEAPTQITDEHHRPAAYEPEQGTLAQFMFLGHRTPLGARTIQDRRRRLKSYCTIGRIDRRIAE